MNSCENQVSPVAVSSGPFVRQALVDAIDKIPAWKRWLICQLLRRAEWKVARAYNTIAAHAINKLGDFTLFEEMRRRGDDAWAKVYDLPNDKAQTRST